MAKWEMWKRGMLSKSKRKPEAQGPKGCMVLNRRKHGSFSDTGSRPGLVWRWMSM